MTDALGDQAEGLPDEELEDAAQEWVDSADAVVFLEEDLEWDINDARFEHAKKVTDIEVDTVTFDEMNFGVIEMSIELHETEEGFADRLKREEEAAKL